MGGFLGSLNSLFGGGDSGGGSLFSGGNILGALATGATIYGTYQQSQDEKEQRGIANQLAADKLAEDKRQFDATLAFKQSQAGGGGRGGGGGGGSGDALKIARSRAIQSAYDSLISANQSGRAGEAAMLSKLIDQIQRVYGSVTR